MATKTSGSSGKKRYWTGISLRVPGDYDGRGAIRVSFVPGASHNTRFGHLGQENGAFPQTFL